MKRHFQRCCRYVGRASASPPPQPPRLSRCRRTERHQSRRVGTYDRHLALVSFFAVDSVFFLGNCPRSTIDSIYSLIIISILQSIYCIHIFFPLTYAVRSRFQIILKPQSKHKSRTIKSENIDRDLNPSSLIEIPRPLPLNPSLKPTFSMSEITIL